MNARSWFRLAPAIAAVGVVAAGFAIAFRRAYVAVVAALGGHDIVGMMTDAPVWERLVLPALGGLGAGVLAFVMARGTTKGGGVGYVMEAIVLGRVRVSKLRGALHPIASWMAIVTGNSLGREGPLIQFGAAAGEAARHVFRIDDTNARVVLAAGVAAGFASAYNAPIAAVLFVVEIVTGVIVLEAVVPVLLAVVIATVVTRHVAGDGPIYGRHDFAAPAVELFAFAGLGLVTGPVGVAFLRVLSMVERWWRVLPLPLRPAVGGAVCGAVLVAVPAVAGNGFEPLGMLLDGRVALAVVAVWLVAKPIATATAVGSGMPGGVFTPTLLLGGCVGTLYVGALHAVLGDGAIGDPGMYALVGLACGLAATTHAPMTAAILACELTGDWGLILPLLLSCGIAAGVARWLYVDSVYTAELTRRGVRWTLTLDGRRVVEG